MSETIIETVEEGLRYLEEHPPTGESFTLSISDALTSQIYMVGDIGSATGVAMAIILDRVLCFGYNPDGFEQRSRYRIYRYTKKL